MSTPDSPFANSFQQAAHYLHAGRTAVRNVVIHDMELPEVDGIALHLGERWGAKDSRIASCHYGAENREVCQYVWETDIAWHAPGLNRYGIGLELAGYAAQKPADWDDTYSHDMLLRAAPLVLDICKRWSIPVQFVNAGGLLASKRGITTHAMVSAAFRKSTHTDPGQGFPMARFLDLVLSA